VSGEGEEDRWGPRAVNRNFAEKMGHGFIVLRMLTGMSQAELASKAGIRANQVSRYETGQVLPQIDQLMKILNALGTDVGDLVVTTQMLSWLDRRLEAQGRGEGAFAPSAWFAWALDEQAAFLERARRLVNEPVPAADDSKVPREAAS